jgi:PAS domain-containing protein
MQVGSIVLELDGQARCLKAWSTDPTLLARPPGPLAYRTIDEVLGPAVGVSFVAAVRRVHATGRVEHLEVPIDLPCGRRWFFADIKRVAAVVMFTAREMAATDTVRWEWDLGANTMTWSAAVSSVLGYAHVDGSPTWWKERLHPQQRAGVLARLGAALASGALAWADRYRFRRVDGNYIELIENAVIERNAFGHAEKVSGMLAEVVESTQRIRTIQATAKGWEACRSGVAQPSRRKRAGRSSR